jgi:hypothetical protein
MSQENQPVELSKEELQKRREEITAFYKDNIKHLKVQKEYEELLRDVEKARAERLQAQMFLAQAYAASEEGEQEGEPKQSSEARADFEAAMTAVNEPKSRNLKRK